MRQKITPKAVLIPTVSLFLICIFVTAALALTNSVTADKIAEIEQQSKQESMKAVCPEAQTFEEITPDVMYEGKDESGNTVGYAISTATMGYGGQVKVMTGINDGKGQTVDAVTSATISSRAVTKAVNEAVQIYKENADASDSSVTIEGGADGYTAVKDYHSPETEKNAKEGE